MKPSVLLNKHAMESIGSILYKLFRYFLLIGVSYLALFPIIKMISASLSIPDDYFSGRNRSILSDLEVHAAERDSYPACPEDVDTGTNEEGELPCQKKKNSSVN